MYRSSQSQLIQRLWGEHKYALIARSPTRARELGRKLVGDSTSLAEALEAMEDIMAGPEVHLPEALADAWAHLQPRVGMTERKTVDSLLETDVEAARWFIGGLAEAVGDGVVAASRLFDHPNGVRRLWLRDARGPTLLELTPDGVVRLPPAEVGEMLVASYGEAAWKTLRLIAERPRSGSEIRTRLGGEALRVLDAGHRVLLLRRVGGYYRSRGGAVKAVLDGLGR